MGLCDKRSATALLPCRTARVPFSPPTAQKTGHREQGPAGAEELFPPPAQEYFRRAKLQLKWYPNKPPNFCLLYALPIRSLPYAAD